VSTAGIWIIAGTVLFLGSRIAIEVFRVSDAASEDRAFALQLVWATSLTAVATVGLCLALVYLTMRSSRLRRPRLAAVATDGWVFETIRAPDVKRGLLAAGAPPSVIGRVQNSYFSLVATEDGLTFWIGSKEPTQEWLVEWSAIRSIGSTTVPWQWLILPSVELEIVRADGTQKVALPLAELGVLQPRPLTPADAEAAVADLRAIRAARVGVAQ